MTEAVTVSSVDVQRARLLVRLNRTLGAASPAYVIKIAEAQPSSLTAGANDSASTHVNGVPREERTETDPESSSHSADD